MVVGQAHDREVWKITDLLKRLQLGQELRGAELVGNVHCPTDRIGRQVRAQRLDCRSAVDFNLSRSIDKIPIEIQELGRAPL